MTSNTFLQSMAAGLAWMEGKDDGVNGQLAILFCLRNRINSGYLNGDLKAIIQAEYSKRELLKQPIEFPDPRDPYFSQLLGYVEGIFEGTIIDNITNGAIYYGPKPYGSGQRVGVVGKLELWN